jgi:hypothetical protein
MEKFAGRVFSLFVSATVASSAFAGGANVPWPKEKAWRWYNGQPWIRGCNYMPASAANRMDMWQEYGSKERFEEMDRELGLAASVGFNTVRVLLEENGFGAWHYEHDDFIRNFEKFLALCGRRQNRSPCAGRLGALPLRLRLRRDEDRVRFLRPMSVWPPLVST